MEDEIFIERKEHNILSIWLMAILWDKYVQRRNLFAARRG